MLMRQLPAQFGDQGLMTTMDAVEVADGQGTVPALGGRLLLPVERDADHAKPWRSRTKVGCSLIIMRNQGVQVHQGGAANLA